MIIVFKFILLLIIFFGLFQFTSFMFDVNNDFIPFVVCSSISIIIFIAGLLNIMYETVLLTVLLSFLSIIFILYKEKKFRNLISSGMWYFLIGSIVFVFLLKGQKLFLYDDFSHWGLVSREILLKNRLPNFTDELILFKSYPTGSASFIYFIGKIMGQSEGVMLYAQSLLYLACIAPLFSLINKRKKSHYIIILLYSLYLFVSNYGMITLYVDTLLTGVALAVTAIILNSYINNQLESAIFPLLLGNSFLILIKNSGLLFAMISTVLFIFLRIKNKPKKYSFFSILGIFAPFLMKLLWDRHVELVFSKDIVSKHSISFTSYQDIIGSKTSQDIRTITYNLLKRSINLKYLDVKLVFLMVLFLSIILLLKYVLGKNKNQVVGIYNEKRVLLIIAVMYVLYQLSLWSMYMFSMPLNEALSLASYMRYNNTMTGYLIGIYIINYFIFDSENENQTLVSPHISYTLFLLIIMSYSVYTQKTNFLNVVSHSQYENSPRRTLLDAISNNKENYNDKIVVYVSSLTDKFSKDYLYFQFKYELRIKDFEIVDFNHFSLLSEIMEKNNVTLITLERDSLINDFLEQRGYDSSDEVLNLKQGD